MKTKTKLIIMLGLALLTILALSSSSVYASTGSKEEIEEVWANIPKKLEANITVSELISNWSNEPYTVNQDNIKGLNLPEGYTCKLIFESGHMIFGDRLALYYNGKNVKSDIGYTIEYVDTKNKISTVDAEVQKLIEDKLFTSTYTYEYSEDINNRDTLIKNATDYLISEVSKLSTVNNATFKMLAMPVDEGTNEFYCNVGIFVDDIYYGAFPCMLDTVKVNKPVEEASYEFCMFSIYDNNGNRIEIMGLGDYSYQEVACELKNITSNYYFQLNTGLNLGESIKLEGLGNFTLARTYKSTNTEDTSTYYEYKSEIKDYTKLKASEQTLEYNFKNLNTNLIQNFILDLKFIGEITIPEVKNVNETDSTTGIKLDADTKVVPENTKLVVEKVTTGTDYNIVVEALGSDVEKFVAYDITLTSNNVAIQPNGKVKISLPIPEGYDASKILVYRVAEDGTKTKLDTKIEGDYVTFETDHFSNYVIAQEKTQEQSQPEQPSTDTNKPTNNNKLDETPKTGTTINIVSTLSLVAIISLAAIIIIKKK